MSRLLLALLLRLPVSILLLTVTSTAVSAQAATGSVDGRITDGRGKRLPGVNVGLRGMALGAATQADGAFRIAGVPAGSCTLEASFIGYETQQQALTVGEGQPATARLTLPEDAAQLGRSYRVGEAGGPKPSTKCPCQ